MLSLICCVCLNCERFVARFSGHHFVEENELSKKQVQCSRTAVLALLFVCWVGRMWLSLYLSLSLHVAKFWSSKSCFCLLVVFLRSSQTWGCLLDSILNIYLSLCPVPQFVSLQTQQNFYEQNTIEKGRQHSLRYRHMDKKVKSVA